MTLINTLNHNLRRYFRVFVELLFYKLPKDIQVFRKDCDTLIERYNTLLEEISEYMKDHSKLRGYDPKNSSLSLSYHDTDSFFLISIKDELANLTDDCEELLEKRSQHPSETQKHNDAIEQYLNQLLELRRYSEQIETALHEYEENIMKIEEEISNNTLCN